MAMWVKELAAKSHVLSLIPGSPWRKERTGSRNLSSDLHVCVGCVHSCPPPPKKKTNKWINTLTYKLKNLNHSFLNCDPGPNGGGAGHEIVGNSVRFLKTPQPKADSKSSVRWAGSSSGGLPASHTVASLQPWFWTLSMCNSLCACLHTTRRQRKLPNHLATSACCKLKCFSSEQKVFCSYKNTVL